MVTIMISDEHIKERCLTVKVKAQITFILKYSTDNYITILYNFSNLN